MPLPRVQSVGNVRDPFLYTIGWDTDVRRSDVLAYQRGHPSTFDNRIQLRPGVGAYLIQFNAFLRPLIHRHWAGMVARLNRMEEARLERFLFGSSRNPLNAVRPGLLDLQHGDCFYCRAPLRRRSEVDHFVPWSRYPEDGLANLVFAHDRCNQAKRDFLPATDHVMRWSERLANDHLVALQDQLQWHGAVEEMRGVARGIYLRLPADAVLWVAGRDFDRPDHGRLRTALT
jgi:5-methylcytosine-specific restriction endonuclease McrA